MNNKKKKGNRTKDDKKFHNAPNKEAFFSRNSFLLMKEFESVIKYRKILIYSCSY